jgi:hypothetical protein
VTLPLKLSGAERGKQRYRAVLEVLSCNPVVAVAERYGAARQTEHGWMARYRTNGPHKASHHPAGNHRADQEHEEAQLRPQAHVPWPTRCGILGRVWALDPANSPDLIERLRPHGRDRDFEVAWVGEGWRSLVDECHAQIVAVFPDYELLNVKQNYGVLVYQAFPRRWADGQQLWTAQEQRVLGSITSEIQNRSEHVCEWCGGAGRLREWRSLELLTLCDPCDHRFPDPPLPLPSRSTSPEPNQPPNTTGPERT